MSKKDATDIVVTLEGEHYELDDGDPSDEAYTMRNTDGYTLEEVRIYLNEPSLHGLIASQWHTLPGKLSAGDDVYVVVENYSDGNTFGRTESMYSACAVFKTQQGADEYVENESHKTDGYFQDHIGFEIYVLELE